jgi:hypothetical protein
MPVFDKPFIIDYDASGAGFGAVLHQDEGLLALFSRPFAAATSSWQPMSTS